MHFFFVISILPEDTSFEFPDFGVDYAIVVGSI
jgi:hypothetical protein